MTISTDYGIHNFLLWIPTLVGILWLRLWILSQGNWICFGWRRRVIIYLELQVVCLKILYINPKRSQVCISMPQLLMPPICRGHCPWHCTQCLTLYSSVSNCTVKRKTEIKRFMRLSFIQIMYILKVRKISIFSYYAKHTPDTNVRVQKIIDHNITVVVVISS